MKIQHFLAITLVFLLSVTLQAIDKSMEYGLQMVKINTSITAQGMGGAGDFAGKEAFSFLQNPAANLYMNNNSVSFSENSWLFDTTIHSIGYCSSGQKSAFGLAMRYLDYGSLEGRDDLGDEIGDFHPMDLDVAMNFGFKINNDISVGSTVHTLYEKIYTESAMGFAADLGIIYQTPINNLSVSANVKHLGSTNKMNEEKIKIPNTREIGLAHSINTLNYKVLLEGKLIQYSDEPKVQAAIGTQLTILKMLNLRAGYKTNHDLENVSAGIGIEYERMSFDYSYSPMDYDFNDVHMLGLSYRY